MQKSTKESKALQLKAKKILEHDLEIEANEKNTRGFTACLLLFKKRLKNGTFRRRNTVKPK